MTRKSLFLIPLAALAVATSAHSQSPTTTNRMIPVEESLVEAIDEVRVPATQTGMLAMIHVKEGQSVDKDGLLADIDNRSTLAAQRVSKGEMDAAKAQAESTAELEVAQKAEEVSKAELDSINEIREKNKNAVSLSEWRKYHFQYEKAIAQVKQAINERLIASLTATAKEAQYDAAAVELDLRKIKAPFKGQVVEVFKKNGEWAQSGEAILYLVGLDRVKVSGFVLAKYASPAEVLGKPVVINVYAAGEKKHTVKGIVGFASPVIEGTGSSHQFRIWAEVENEKSVDPVTRQESWKIQPGTMAQMTIDLSPPAAPRPAAPAKAEPAKSGAAPVGAKGAAADAKSSPAVGGKRESLKPIVPAPDAPKSEPIKAEPAKGTGKSESALEPKTASSASKER